MGQKPVGSRIYPRYKIMLLVEVQSSENHLNSRTIPALRFRSYTRDISLGGVSIELEKNTEGLDENWSPEWFADRYFWMRITGISSMPEGLFTKAKFIRFVEKKKGDGAFIGMEFTDLVQTLTQDLKEYLDSLSRFE